MKHTLVICASVTTALLVTNGCKKEAAADEQVPAVDTAQQPVIEAPAATQTPDPAPTGSPEDVIASVNDLKLLRKDMDAMIEQVIKIQNIPAEQAGQAKEMLSKQFAYSFVMRNILTAAAKAKGLTLTDEDRAAQLKRFADARGNPDITLDEIAKNSPFGEEEARKEFDDGALIDKLLKQEVLDKIEVTDAEIQDVIDQIKKRNAETEEKNKTLVSKEDKRKQLDDIKKQISDGADFAELAKKNSDCPSGQKGGDLGTFTRERMVKPFSDAAFALDIGAVSDIVETQFGYHIIKVTDKKPAKEASGETPAEPETVTASHILLSFDKEQPIQPVPSADEVREQLKGDKSRGLVQEYIEGLKSTANIKTIFEDLPL